MLQYFVVWLAVCSLWFQGTLLVQACVIALFYTSSQIIGTFKYRKYGLSADGFHTMILLPGIWLGGQVSLIVHGVRSENMFEGILAVGPAFILGHVGAFLLTFIWSFIEESYRNSKQ